MSEIKKIAFIGSGNVASHMAKSFTDKGFTITGIYGRNLITAQALAAFTNSKWGAISDINFEEHDLVIISVPDNAIAEIINILPHSNTLIAHTSGSMEMEVLNKFGKRIGVFYPLQTFSKEKEVDFSKIPMMVEAKTDEDLVILEKLAQNLSLKVFRITSAQRKKIHIAAVFSSNFTNYLYHIAEDLLTQDNIPFEVIQPLIEETTDKIQHLKPYHAQTGPAVRNDLETISSHLQDLESIPEYHEIYKLLSHHIIKSRKQ
ncbi:MULTISPECIES: Rossmann-like and DUF2520 domain-containing protein [unclassified Lentimicrobium]|uniref:Rossmann-like and DUF2520 domain-containing protein n=1 Tax=unclassified Lentimicrobium TaxID=2677434 RepID=UPI001553989F|nr:MULTISPECIES: Rossmann-like and DUF2520 domain-containing protein [unclassified Lentimicrobium]NPD44297.1 DUF2520 domain-containing protein [Lentimicrobium sp. S6]NPD84598.1 DUF2520 domain-containing protein [Lentimicrobium sp. L6]